MTEQVTPYDFYPAHFVIEGNPPPMSVRVGPVPRDTTTAPVPSGQADSLSRSFLSGQDAIGAHIPEPARFPSHQDEIDAALGREPNRAVELAVDYLALRDLVSEQARAILECKRRLASIPVTVATADLAYVSTMLGFIALRLDAAVA